MFDLHHPYSGFPGQAGLKTIPASARDLALCEVKASLASDLTRSEVGALMNWCDCQCESLWRGLSLQEILNIYRASVGWVTFEAWAQEDPRAARAAWNRAVIARDNRMQSGDA